MLVDQMQVITLVCQCVKVSDMIILAFQWLPVIPCFLSFPVSCHSLFPVIPFPVIPCFLSFPVSCHSLFPVIPCFLSFPVSCHSQFLVNSKSRSFNVKVIQCQGNLRSKSAKRLRSVKVSENNFAM